MTKRNMFISAAIVILIPVAAAAWWMLSPLFISTTVDEEFPMAASADVPSNLTMSQVETVMTVMAQMDQPTMEEAMPSEGDGDAGPVVVASGSFRGADSFHQGSGTATIYRIADGSHILRFEDFMVTNGPDLRVLLAKPRDPQSRNELQDGGYINLAKLKGNIGNQNYEIPADIDLAEQGSIVIYCMPFHVIFSVASLDSAG